MIPAVGEQDTANVHKQCFDWRAFFHLVVASQFGEIGFVIA